MDNLDAESQVQIAPQRNAGLRLAWRTWAAALVTSASIATVTLLGGALPAQVE